MRYFRDYTKRQILSIVAGYAQKWCGLLNEFAPPGSWERVDRLVFVCKGNICRSAYAEAFALKLGLRAISFGLEAGGGGAPANEHVIGLAKQQNLDLSDHRTTGPHAVFINREDLICCMEVGQARQCRSLFPESSVALIGLLIGIPNIVDPHGRSDYVFERELAHIRLALRIAARLKDVK